MTTYFIRRIMLVPVTFVIITCMFYTVLRLVPGGPVENALLQIKMQQQSEGGAMAMDSELEGAIDEKALENLRKYYRLDKPIFVGYLYWLFGILTGDFGMSSQRSEPALGVIVSKFHISLRFGLVGYFATWLVCIPLGVTKAIKHKSVYDTGTSIVVFAGYSVPGFVACLVLLVYFGGGSYFDLVPLRGYKPDNFDELDFFMKVVTSIHHMIVPLIGYMIAGFAAMTILMKNSLLENLGADYVRTAFAKGLSERRVIFLHALRNSLIPITAGIGHALGLILAGSFLIEKVCNIPGMGLLGFESILSRDFPVTLGILVFAVVIRLTGNIFSDIVWALIDPRIRFH